LPLRVVPHERFRRVVGEFVRLLEPEIAQDALVAGRVRAGKITDRVLALPAAYEISGRRDFLALVRGRCRQQDEERYLHGWILLIRP
jgi:hypothetical protein